MGRYVVLLFFVNLALIIAAIADCLGGENEPRYFSRRAWALIILLLPLLGPLTWFLTGRPGREEPASPRRAPDAPLAPDDDPEFLKDLERRLREDTDDG